VLGRAASVFEQHRRHELGAIPSRTEDCDCTEGFIVNTDSTRAAQSVHGTPEFTRRRGGRPRQASIDRAIISAARTRLLSDGYAQMTVADVAADAGVTRPSIYRRWTTKLDLVVAALDRGFWEQQASTAFAKDIFDFPTPRDVLVEAIRRVDPAAHNPDAMILISDFASEYRRTPELMQKLRRHGVEPRLQVLRIVINEFQKQSIFKPSVDVDPILQMCSGSYISAFFRGQPTHDLAERVADLLWPVLAADPESTT
jgi:AcrR family transcriptional regulator